MVTPDVIAELLLGHTIINIVFSPVIGLMLALVRLIIPELFYSVDRYE
jgi:hypothetical protein